MLDSDIDEESKPQASRRPIFVLNDYVCLPRDVEPEPEPEVPLIRAVFPQQRIEDLSRTVRKHSPLLPSAIVERFY